MKQILILDIEGTLLTTGAGTIHPRPGLKAFLEFVVENFDEIGFYTLLNHQAAKAILTHLSKNDLVPTQLLEPFNYIKGTGFNKDLTYVPGATLDQITLIDDSPSMIVKGQEDRWIQIRSFVPPSRTSAFGQVAAEAEDTELQRVTEVIHSRIPFGH